MRAVATLLDNLSNAVIALIIKAIDFIKAKWVKISGRREQKSVLIVWFERVINDFSGRNDGRDRGGGSITPAAILNLNFIAIFNTAEF